jgi:hypothetical protein
MAFPTKKKDMEPPAPPDKKKGLMIAIGIGKPKMPPPKPPADEDDDDTPDTTASGNGGGDDAAPAAPPDATPAPAGGGADTDDNSDAADPRKMEKAGIIRADHHCQNCENWEADTGNCTILGPGFAPDDACLRYFEEASGDEDQNSAPDTAIMADMGGGAPAGA